MRAKRPAIWRALQAGMRPDQPYALQEIYAVVGKTIVFDSEDLESDGVSQSKWERNVRNLLQYRLDTGDVHRTDRGEYVLPDRQIHFITRDPSSLPPWSNRSAGFLQRRLIEGLGSALAATPAAEELATKPLRLRLNHPLPARATFYIYLATDHPSERSLGDYRIQVILPEHRDHHRGRFDRTNAAIPFLLGFVPEFDVFVCWDADLHDAGAGIPYSKGVQVHAGTVFSAAALGMATQVRRIRSVGGPSEEVVVAGRSTHLQEVLQERRALSMLSILTRP